MIDPHPLMKTTGDDKLIRGCWSAGNSGYGIHLVPTQRKSMIDFDRLADATIDEIVEAHAKLAQEIAKRASRLPSGTRVRVRSLHGSALIGVLAKDYEPPCEVVLMMGSAERTMTIEGCHVRSVEKVAG